MGLVKDPEEDITNLEEIKYDDIFSDINTPGIWLVETEEDLKTSLAIVLDGHSTILVFDRTNEDLPWTAYHELGQYKYTPEHMEDGIAIFPHNFYFEYNILVGDQKVEIASTFDGSGISAITLPMKDTTIDEFFIVLRNRIEEAINSELQAYDEPLKIVKGKKIQFPESLSIKIGMKLSLMGIALSSMKAKKISVVEDRKEKEEIVEEVFDEPPTKVKAMLEEEEKESKKRKRAKTKKKKVEKAAEEVIAPAKVSRSATAGAGPPTPKISPSPPPSVGAPGGPPPASASPAPPPPVASSKGSPPPPTPTPAGSPKPVMKPAAMPSPEPTPVESEIGGIADEEMEEAVMDEEMDMMDDLLIAKGMEDRDKPMTLRYTHASYFSRMLLNRAYPLVVKINMEEVGVQKSITSVISGEKISEKEETLVVSEEDPNVTIRPEFPGCFVVPNEHSVDIREDKIEVKFYVTPLALGLLDGSIRFIQSGKSIHSMSLETKVITHRVSKWLAGIGASTSAIPFLMAFFLDETVPQFMEKRLDGFLPSISEYGGILVGLVTALFLFLSAFVYRLQKPRKTTSSLAFPR